MPAQPGSSRAITLSLSPEEQWTLHHVLLDRIEHELTTEADPPPIEIYQAFDALDGGETRFTADQLEAIQDVLAAYQRATDWEIERSRLEGLLRRIATTLETPPADSTD